MLIGNKTSIGDAHTYSRVDILGRCKLCKKESHDKNRGFRKEYSLTAFRGFLALFQWLQKVL